MTFGFICCSLFTPPLSSFSSSSPFVEPHKVPAVAVATCASCGSASVVEQFVLLASCRAAGSDCPPPSCPPHHLQNCTRVIASAVATCASCGFAPTVERGHDAQQFSTPYPAHSPSQQGGHPDGVTLLAYDARMLVGALCVYGVAGSMQVVFGVAACAEAGARHFIA
eukprot:932487-Pelagomonas_calceolata.AAC.1